MSIKLVPIIEIVRNDAILFKYPPHTLLDKIVDVWEIIIDYHRHYRPFVIGNYSGKYEGYRLITHEECKSHEFISLFASHYRINHGIHASDKIYDSHLYNDNKVFSIYDQPIKCHRSCCDGIIRLSITGLKGDVKKYIQYIETGKVNTLRDGINNIPKMHQPSGTCNFSRIDPPLSVSGLFVQVDLSFPIIPEKIIVLSPETPQREIKNDYLYLNYQ